jgi:predicted enzyme related to lactoylglutathione lyase
MSEEMKPALNGQGEDLFAGIPVSNYEVSLDWYQRLFGCEPSFYPNDVEAVWQVAEHLLMYIIVLPEHAGHSIQNVMVTDLDSLVSQIAARGIQYSKEERPERNTRKVMYYDPDGNEIGLIHVSS